MEPALGLSRGAYGTAAGHAILAYETQEACGTIKKQRQYLLNLDCFSQKRRERNPEEQGAL